jgi:hypothetical protein
MPPLIALLLRILIPIAVKEVLTKAVQKPKEFEMNEALAGLIRHALTVAAGYLVARGQLDPTTADTIVGALMGLGGVVWSVYAKRKEG